MDERKVDGILSDAREKMDQGLFQEAIVSLLSALQDSVNVDASRKIYLLLSLVYEKNGKSELSEHYKKEANLYVKHCTERIEE